MNYFEFRQQLLRDSFTKDEEFHRLRREDLRCARAYTEAMEFEKTLKRALWVKTPDTLKDSIVLRQATQHSNHRLIRNYAMAATIFLTFIIMSATWYMKQPGPIERFVIEALMMEPEIYMSEEALPKEEVDKLFALLNVKIEGDLGQIHFMKTCPTPGGTGARIVLMTDNGPVTLLYMPNADLNKRIDFELEKYKGSIIAMESAAVAIIGDDKQQLSYVEAIVHNSISML